MTVPTPEEFAELTMQVGKIRATAKRHAEAMSVELVDEFTALHKLFERMKTPDAARGVVCNTVMTFVMTDMDAMGNRLAEAIKKSMEL